MEKKLFCLVLAFVFAVGLGLTARAEDLALPAPSCILMEKDTGQILYESNAHEKLRPASVTKIMTLLLVMEALDNGSIGWDDTVTTSAAAAAKGGSQIYLEENEQLPLREMLKSVVVSSANDCACALAEHVAGSEAAFVSRMNDRAAELGMTDTHFVNCTGLDDGPDADKLVRFYDGTTGLKTGYTSAAGYCLSASAERGGMELVAVVLHCKTSVDRFESAKALLNYGFSNYALVTPQPESGIPPVPVVLGRQESVTPVPEHSTPVLLEKALAAQVQTAIAVDETVQAPVAAGQRIGTMTVTAGEQLIAEIPLVAPEDVAALTFPELWAEFLRRICMSA